MSVPAWLADAACLHHDPDLFFPEGTTGPSLQQAREAKQVCLSCPVQARCLDYAVRNGLAFGIWGGASEAERRAMRRITRGEVA